MSHAALLLESDLERISDGAETENDFSPFLLRVFVFFFILFVDFVFDFNREFCFNRRLKSIFPFSVLKFVQTDFVSSKRNVKSF